MPRFYLRAEAVSGPRVTFDAQETRHLARVLRLRPGDVVHAVDGQGQELTVRLTQVSTRSAEGLILGREAGRSESPLLLTLVQGLPKGDKMEAIIRMATELGVTRVVPVITERTVGRADATRGAGRLLRWQRVAREAAKQCGRTVIPEVTASRALAEWLGDGSPEGLLLCLWEDERARLADRLPPAPVAAWWGARAGWPPTRSSASQRRARWWPASVPGCSGPRRPGPWGWRCSRRIMATSSPLPGTDRLPGDSIV